MRSWRRGALLRLLIVVLACAGGARVLRAQATDVIRGTIAGLDSQPLEGARVTVSSYQGDVQKTATTDKSGRFTVIFINGEGDYWIDVTKIGFAPKRYEVRKLGDEAVVLANTRMSPVGAQLGTVNVTGERNRAVPGRNATEPDVSGGDRALGATAVAPDQAGNLAAMAAAEAGFQIIPGLDGAADAFSAFGLSGDQNNTTFNGLGSGVSDLPPDILVTTSIRPYPFDVSIGGFSGAQVSIQTIPGTNFSRRAITTVGLTPPPAAGSEIARAQGLQNSYVRIGGNAAGPIVPDHDFYNIAYNVGRRFSDLRTLLNTNTLGLTAAGVAPDSAVRLADILQRQGIGTTPAGLPGVWATDLAQLSGNLDLIPSASGTGSSFTVGGTGNYRKTQPISRGGLVLATPSHAGETSFWDGSATVVHSIYFRYVILSKTTLGLSASGNSTSPYETSPEGNVRVASVLPDGSESVKPLLFGGGSNPSSLSDRWVQLKNELTWYSEDNKHSLKLASSVTADGFESDASQSRFGTFSYNSLADLEAEHPAGYTRSLGVTTRSGKQVTGSVSFGDSWRPNPGLQVQYGLRADANQFVTRPAFNEDILNTFGANNTAVPNRVYLSPRIGMQWYYGNPAEVQYAPGSARPPRAVIHAGIGVFQNMALSQLASAAVASTGLPNSTRSISCIGAATPAPDWSAYLNDPSSIPSTCADGSDGTVFATASPSVTLFDPGFRQPRSVRAAADWSDPVLDNRFVLGVQSIVSSGRDQQGAVDINLNPTARFTLAGEGNRPVFVDPAAIVPATGAVAIAGSRVAPGFQQVWLTKSNLWLASKQLTVNVKPVTANPMLRWAATYTLLDARQSFTGFASTAGDPFDVQSGPALQAARHTVQLQWNNFPIFDLVYVTAQVQLMSGQHYTPMVAGDVNGDGMQNDRAFIMDPSKVADASEATAMRSLLANTTPSVRDCLMRQLNTLAARGSCQTPWTASGALLLTFNPEKVGLPKRATVTLTVQNPFALADVALHGSNDLRGWGERIPPDQNLLFVRGFDPTTRQFKYDVNQRFGSTRPQQSSVYASPTVSLGISIDIGVPRERQVLTQGLNLGRTSTGTVTKLPAFRLAAVGLSTIPNPIQMVLAQSDSLKLSRVQADSLAMLNASFTTFADSVWLPVGRELAALPNDYSSGDAYELYVTAREQTIDYLLTLVPHVKELLTPAQRRKLPALVTNYLDERVLKFLRSSTIGSTGAARP
ncbi:MAG TPA: carboxypeptidase-like regulatory domain-containing protein [Gemmatimonadaceae bacterium]|jgi:hypothetical protein